MWTFLNETYDVEWNEILFILKKFKLHLLSNNYFKKFISFSNVQYENQFYSKSYQIKKPHVLKLKKFYTKIMTFVQHIQTNF